MNLINPDGGDLGRAEYCTKLYMIPDTIEVVADLLDKIRPFIPKGNMISHAVEFDPGYKPITQEIINIYKRRLPSTVEFYECDGQTIFDVRSMSGGIVNRSVFYLITK